MNSESTKWWMDCKIQQKTPKKKLIFFLTQTGTFYIDLLKSKSIVLGRADILKNVALDESQVKRWFFFKIFHVFFGRLCIY